MYLFQFYWGDHLISFLTGRKSCFYFYQESWKYTILIHQIMMDSCYLPIHIVWFHLYISSCFLLFTFIFCIFGVLAYISTSINDGPGCLMLRCPDPSCGAAIGQDMIDILALNEDKDKYRRYLLRSYIEDNRKVHLYLPSLLLFLLVLEHFPSRWRFLYFLLLCRPSGVLPQVVIMLLNM